MIVNNLALCHPNLDQHDHPLLISLRISMASPSIFPSINFMSADISTFSNHYSKELFKTEFCTITQLLVVLLGSDVAFADLGF